MTHSESHRFGVAEWDFLLECVYWKHFPRLPMNENRLLLLSKELKTVSHKDISSVLVTIVFLKYNTPLSYITLGL